MVDSLLAPAEVIIVEKTAKRLENFKRRKISPPSKWLFLFLVLYFLSFSGQAYNNLRLDFMEQLNTCLIPKYHQDPWCRLSSFMWLPELASVSTPIAVPVDRILHEPRQPASALPFHPRGWRLDFTYGGNTYPYIAFDNFQIRGHYSTNLC